MSEVTAVKSLSEERVNVETRAVTQESPPNPQNDGEVQPSLDEIVEQMRKKFAKVSTELYHKLDEMGQRLDNLEGAIKAGMDTKVEPMEPLELLKPKDSAAGSPEPPR